MNIVQYVVASALIPFAVAFILRLYYRFCRNQKFYVWRPNPRLIHHNFLPAMASVGGANPGLRSIALASGETKYPLINNIAFWLWGGSTTACEYNDPFKNETFEKWLRRSSKIFFATSDHLL